MSRSKDLSNSLLGAAAATTKHSELLKPMLPSAQGLQFLIFIHSLLVKNALQEM